MSVKTYLDAASDLSLSMLYLGVSVNGWQCLGKVLLTAANIPNPAQKAVQRSIKGSQKQNSPRHVNPLCSKMSQGH